VFFANVIIYAVLKHFRSPEFYANPNFEDIVALFKLEQNLA
jgi:hypothetical protein